MRSSNRTAFGVNRGSKNPIITNATTFPENPRDKDIFINPDTLIMFFYNFATTTWIPLTGGLSVWTAGEILYQGESIYISQTNGKLYKSPVDADFAVGFVYAGCIADAKCYFVRSGIAYVLPESTLSLTAGYVIYSSGSEAGRVKNAASIPSSTFHWREQGHVLEDSASNGALTRCVIHHN